MPKSNSQKQLDLTVKKILFPLLTGLTVFMTSVVISALTVSKSAYPKDNPGVYLLVSAVISGLIAGFISTIKTRSNGLVTGLITGSVLAFVELLIIVCISLFSVKQSAFLILPCCIIPSGLSGILGVNLNFK